MNINEMLDKAKQTDADLMIATLPINEEEAKRMGVMKINDNKKITDFYEKPQSKELLEKFSLHTPKSPKIHPINEKIFFGSMGIYIFKKTPLSLC